MLFPSKYDRRDLIATGNKIAPIQRCLIGHGRIIGGRHVTGLIRLIQYPPNGILDVVYVGAMFVVQQVIHLVQVRAGKTRIGQAVGVINRHPIARAGADAQIMIIAPAAIITGFIGYLVTIGEVGQRNPHITIIGTGIDAELAICLLVQRRQTVVRQQGLQHVAGARIR